MAERDKLQKLIGQVRQLNIALYGAETITFVDQNMFKRIIPDTENFCISDDDFETLENIRSLAFMFHYDEAYQECKNWIKRLEHQTNK